MALGFTWLDRFAMVLLLMVQWDLLQHFWDNGGGAEGARGGLPAFLTDARCVCGVGAVERDAERCVGGARVSSAEHLSNVVHAILQKTFKFETAKSCPSGSEVQVVISGVPPGPNSPSPKVPPQTVNIMPMQHPPRTLDPGH